MSQAISETFVEIRAELDGLRSDLKQANKMIGGIGKGVSITGLATSLTGVVSAIKLIGGAAKLIVAPFKFAFAAIKKVAGIAVGIITKLFSGLFSVVKMVGRGIAKAFSFGKEYIKGAIVVAREFGSQMSAVGALTETVGTKSFTVLREKALELGRSTEFSASQAAMGMANFARTGQDVDEILKSIGPTLDFATANFLDLNTASDIAARVMGGMGLSANEVTRAMDAMTVGANKSNQNVNDLGEAMKNVGASAKSAGMSLEQTVASLMAFAEAGRRGGEAGTALKMILLKIPSKNATKLFKKLGMSAANAAGGMRPLADIISEMKSKMSNMKGLEKMKALVDAFGERAGPGLSVLLDVGGKAIDKYTQLIQDNAGMSARNAAIQRDDLSNSFKIVGSAADDLRIRLIDVLEPLIRGANENAVEALNTLSTFVKTKGPEIRDALVKAFTELKVDVIDALTVTVGFVSVSIENILTKLGKAKTALSGTGSAIKDAFAQFFGQDLVASNTGPLERTVLAIRVAFLKIEMGFRAVMNVINKAILGLTTSWTLLKQGAVTPAVMSIVAGVLGEKPSTDSSGDRDKEFNSRMASILADTAAMAGQQGNATTVSSRERGEQMINSAILAIRGVTGLGPDAQNTSGPTLPRAKARPDFPDVIPTTWMDGFEKHMIKATDTRAAKVFADAMKLGLFAGTGPVNEVNATNAASAFTGTVDTVFGAMKFGQDNQVKQLEDIKRINRKIAANTRNNGSTSGGFS
tara:strand:- start:1925 stop:4180 length:2256 start_codon:yes stop_codon:yes gene_type:complete